MQRYELILFFLILKWYIFIYFPVKIVKEI